MNKLDREYVEYLLAQPDNLLQKPPFFREYSYSALSNMELNGIASVPLTGTVPARLPRIGKVEIPQEQYLLELNVHTHKALFDENIPSITIKNNKNGFIEIEQYRIGVPFQILVRDKQVRHLCVNHTGHILLNTNPTDLQNKNFIRFKQLWDSKNMEGIKTQFVKDQKSYGDAAVLFFMNNRKKLSVRNYNFEDGYVIITHKDDEGRHILECLYYSNMDYDGNVTVYLDCYDDEKMTRFTTTTDAGGVSTSSGWIRHAPVVHGFSENPLVTRRGSVAWDKGQRIIDSYEALYNTYIVVEKRHGWGIIYVRGKINPNAKKLAGQILLNDTSMDPVADAKTLDPPSSQNAEATLKKMEQSIMISCGTTFVLPEDIKISGDASGLAVEMTQELDMATAQDGVIEWQNAMSKMSRLFKEGISMELVNSGKDEFSKAATDFMDLDIHSEFRVWKPKSEEAHNNMLTSLYSSGNGGISRRTYIEKNTISTPDEVTRIQKEHEEAIREQEEQARKAAELAKKTSEETIVSE